MRVKDIMTERNNWILLTFNATQHIIDKQINFYQS